MHDIIKNKKVSFKVINKVINQRRVTSKFLPREFINVEQSYACPIDINIYPHSLLKLNSLTINAERITNFNNNLLKTS